LTPAAEARAFFVPVLVAWPTATNASRVAPPARDAPSAIRPGSRRASSSIALPRLEKRSWMDWARYFASFELDRPNRSIVRSRLLISEEKSRPRPPAARRSSERC
jgi:hypothetical protein